LGASSCSQVITVVCFLTGYHSVTGHQAQLHVKPPSLLVFSMFTWISSAFDPHILLLHLTLNQTLSQFNI